MMDMIERATPTIIKRYLATLSVKERVSGYCTQLYMLQNWHSNILPSIHPFPPPPLCPPSPLPSLPSLPSSSLFSLPFLPPSHQTELRLSSLNITWLADRSSCFLEQGGSRENLRDAWTQCLAGLLEPHVLPDACPTSLHIAWPYAFHRMVKAYAVLDPG